MISNKLLSEVYNFEVKDFVQLGTDDVTYEVRFNGLKNGTNYNIINIYELAHKCKEWALKQGYYLRAEQGINYHDNLQWTCFLNKNMNDGADYTDYWNLTEVEAIIKACEWILDNKPL